MVGRWFFMIIGTIFSMMKNQAMVGRWFFMIEKIVPMITASNQRPTIAWRIWSAASRLLMPRQLGDELACCPNTR